MVIKANTQRREKTAVFFTYPVSWARQHKEFIADVERLRRGLKKMFVVLEAPSPRALAEMRDKGLIRITDLVRKQLEEVDLVIVYMPTALPSLGVMEEMVLGKALGKRVFAIVPESIRQRLAPFFTAGVDQVFDSPTDLIRALESGGKF